MKTETDEDTVYRVPARDMPKNALIVHTTSCPLATICTYYLFCIEYYLSGVSKKDKASYSFTTKLPQGSSLRALGSAFPKLIQVVLF